MWSYVCYLVYCSRYILLQFLISNDIWHSSKSDILQINHITYRDFIIWSITNFCRWLFAIVCLIVKLLRFIVFSFLYFIESIWYVYCSSIIFFFCFTLFNLFNFRINILFNEIDLVVNFYFIILYYFFSLEIWRFF